MLLSVVGQITVIHLSGVSLRSILNYSVSKILQLELYLFAFDAPTVWNVRPHEIRASPPILPLSTEA